MGELPLNDGHQNNSLLRIFVCTVLICVSILLLGNNAAAGDEEMFSPYMEFDPETGFMIPADKQTSDHKNQNDAAELVGENREAITTNSEQSPLVETSDLSLAIWISIVLVFLFLGSKFVKKRYTQ